MRNQNQPVAQILALAAVIVWVILFLAPALAPGRALLAVDLVHRYPPWDASVGPDWEAENHLLFDQAVQFYPWRLISREQTSAGLPPLWNPYAGTGSPLLANEQSATLAPVERLVSGLAPTRAPAVAAAIRLTIAGAGMILLLAALGAGPMAAAFGAIAFLGSGAVTILLYHPNSNATMWLPLAAYLSLALARSGNARTAAFLSLVLGAHLLGGHPETSLYVSITSLLFFGLGRLAPTASRGGIGSGGAGRSGLRGPFVRLLLAHLLGALVAAPQILPFLEYLREGAVFSHRAGLRFANAPACAAGILIPELFGTPDRPNTYFGPQNYHAVATQYAGMATVILALWAAIRAFPRRADARRRTLVLALAVTAALTLLLTYPTPLWHLAGYVPLFRVSANVTGLTLVFVFAVALLGAFGLEELAGGTRAKKGSLLSEPSDRVRTNLLATVISVGALAALAAGILLPLFRERLLAMGAERLAARYAAVDYATPIEYYLGRLPLVLDALRATLVRTGVLALLLALLVGPGSRIGKGTALVSLALLVHLGIDLGQFGRGYVPAIPEAEVFPRTAEIERISSLPGLPRVLATGRAMPPNTLNAYAIEDFRVHDAVGSSSHSRLEEAMSDAPFMRRRLDSYDRALLNVAGINVLAVENKEEVEVDAGSGFELIERGALTLLENERAWPRAFFCAAARQAESDSAAIAMTRAMETARAADSLGVATAVPPEIVLTPARNGEAVASERFWAIVRWLFPAVTGAPPPSLVREAAVLAVARDSLGAVGDSLGAVGDSLAAAGDSLSAAVEIGRLIHSPLVVSAAITAPRSGWLVLLDQDFPGWEVRVDGEAAPAARVAGLFRGVRVDAGFHSVAWHYRPASFALGLALALPALLLVLAGVIAGTLFTHRPGR